MADKPQALTLTNREMWELLQISEPYFYKLKARGDFDKLQSPIRNRYSRERVEAWIASRPVRAYAVAS